jgi:hypothetical protein
MRESPHRVSQKTDILSESAKKIGCAKAAELPLGQTGEAPVPTHVRTLHAVGGPLKRVRLDRGQSGVKCRLMLGSHITNAMNATRYRLFVPAPDATLD